MRSGAVPSALAPLLAFSTLAAGCAPSPAPQGSPLPDVSALFATPPPAPTDTLAPAGQPLVATGQDPTPTAQALGVTGQPLTPPGQPPTAAGQPPTAGPPAASDPPCAADDDCGYDPRASRCGADPRYNKQPPLVDQGIVCYCDAATGACALLRVDPVPCEGDSSCAVRADPRPHPVRVDAAHPYHKPARCRRARAGAPHRTDRYVTCERTNICTMHTRECATP